MKAPRKPNLDANRCILPYMKSMLHYKIFYEARRPAKVYGYPYANLVDSISNRRSTSGFMFSVRSGFVSWSKKK